MDTEAIAMRHTVPGVISFIVLGLVGCGGVSDQEQAQNEVCDVRTDVQSQIAELGDLRLGTATVDGISRRLDQVEDDVARIQTSGAELDEQRKSQVQSASETFAAQIDSIRARLRKTASPRSALTNFQNALIQLRDTYRRTLATIDCG
jgi:hypothetical protein